MSNGTGHIRLTSHPGSGAPPRFPIRWGAPTARERGPVIGTVTAANRDAIGAHGGSYALYRALAVSAGALNPISRPDFTIPRPPADMGRIRSGRMRAASSRSTRGATGGRGFSR